MRSGCGPTAIVSDRSVPGVGKECEDMQQDSDYDGCKKQQSTWARVERGSPTLYCFKQDLKREWARTVRHQAFLVLICGFICVSVSNQDIEKRVAVQLVLRVHHTGDEKLLRNIIILNAV
ncbi:hypothetical protein B0H19DRAFT_1055625 [Mycena capillaripes]|nr:hypothetical protein B0H19DRAFT_1055625 [Mycena capillaripes]